MRQSRFLITLFNLNQGGLRQDTVSDSPSLHAAAITAFVIPHGAPQMALIFWYFCFKPARLLKKLLKINGSVLNAAWN